MSFVVIFKVRDGSIYEQPVAGVRHYWQALRLALTFHGLTMADVIVCN